MKEKSKIRFELLGRVVLQVVTKYACEQSFAVARAQKQKMEIPRLENNVSDLTTQPPILALFLHINAHPRATVG